MKVCTGIGMVIAVLFFGSVSHVSAAEIINLFSSDITINKDSSVTVVETIDYDFGTTEKHGIFRFIPTTHTEKAGVWYKTRLTDITIEGVQRDGKDEPYEVTDEGGKVNVKIGDADVTIQGRHLYEITYTLRGALLYPQQLPPEIYWNVNGGEWEIPMLTVRATLHDNGMLSSQRSCYKGRKGESTSCTILTVDNAVTFEASLVKPGEEMTIANALNLKVVPEVKVERVKIALLLLIFAPLWLIGLAVYVYRYRTEYKTTRTVIAEYEPYKGVLPMQMGVLKDASLDPKDITAGIVYLAEQGYLSIKKIERKVLFLFNVDDYEITLLKASEGNTVSTDILTLLFDDPTIVHTVTSLSDLKSDSAKQTQNHTLVQSLEKTIIADLKKEDFYQSPSSDTTKFQWLIWGLTLCSFGVLFVLDGVVAVIVVAVMLMSSILVAFLARRLTKKGYAALAHLDGFKLFLSVTEKDRYEFHNAPEKSPEMFMAFLPYAIAFGVEKKWAEVFEGITIPSPSWYDGGSAGAFQAANLTTSLGGFSSSLSASSGASASSGGGSAGGGGGGGGGGSW